jgi:2-dehydropantoate 2-reductase
MEDWLRGHFLMNAAMAAEAMKVGGHEKAFQSIANIKEMIDLMREMVPLLKRKGSKTDMLTSLITHLPSTIAAVLLQKLSGRGSLAGEIMHRMEGSGHTTPEMNFFYLENIINDSKKYNIRLPKLMATISVAN